MTGASLSAFSFMASPLQIDHIAPAHKDVSVVLGTEQLEHCSYLSVSHH
jgi:hypothetical protein